MAFLSGTTLLGGEVADEVRGRVFGFVNMSTRVVLMLAISLSSVLVGLGSDRVISRRRPVRVDLDHPDPAARRRRGRRARRHRRVPPDGRQAGRAGAGRPVGLAARPAARRARDRLAPAGVFIVFEGGEGSGKSTQVDLLAAALIADGRDVVVTREPGATEVGRSGSAACCWTDQPPTARPGSSLAPRAEALLYAADRAHHVASVVRPALAKGAVVISDRYIDSSLAYQGAGRTLPVEEVSWLSAWATGGLQPDLVVLLDIDPRSGWPGRAAGAGTTGWRANRRPSTSGSGTRSSTSPATDPAATWSIDATARPSADRRAVLERVHELLPASAAADAG